MRFIDLSGQETDSTILNQARVAQDELEARTCKGSEFLGWLDLPTTMLSEIPRIQECANQIRKSDALVVIGIGGSYLGARAVIEALQPSYSSTSSTIQSEYSTGFPIFFAGQNLDAQYHHSLLQSLGGKRYSVNAISKSGTTTESALAFRYFWNDLTSRFDAKDISQLVVATTDEKKGSLRTLADQNKLGSFVIPDDVGGRFSVFTAVGLLPIAAAGIDIKGLLNGAQAMSEKIRQKVENNIAIEYAAFRVGQYQRGKRIEVLSYMMQRLAFVAEWWKQLYGESEGKEQKGIFPASVTFTTDLHSLGQWVQEGERNIFETSIDIVKDHDIAIPKDEKNLDQLNYLVGRSMHEVNRIAQQATLEAHKDGGVPCAKIEIDELTPESLGGLLYFYEYSCAISAAVMKVNPFDQPGVEAYKKNMFRLLGKP